MAPTAALRSDVQRRTNRPSPPSSGNAKDEGGEVLFLFSRNIAAFVAIIRIASSSLDILFSCCKIYIIYTILDIRYSQLEDEQDHKELTETNKKELLQQKLDRLRSLKDEIAKDEWMFEDKL